MTQQPFRLPCKYQTQNYCYISFSFYFTENDTCMLTVALPGFQPAGHTSPCWSVYWKACTRRNVSSTDRPTGRSFIVICLRTPLSSMMKRPLNSTKQSFIHSNCVLLLIQILHVLETGETFEQQKTKSFIHDNCDLLLIKIQLVLA